MISLNEAVKKGISRLRDPQWVDPKSYIRIHLVREGHGPYVDLFARSEQQAEGQATPKTLLYTLFDWDAVDSEPYTGELDEADTQ